MSCVICFDYLAEFVCSCKKLFLCRYCLVDHDSQGLHKIENLSTFELYTDNLNYIGNIKAAKSKILSESKRLITFVKNCAKSALNDLNNLEKECNILLIKTKTENAKSKNISELHSKALFISNTNNKIEGFIKNVYSQIYYLNDKPINEWTLIKKVQYFNKCMNDDLTLVSELMFSDDKKYAFRCKIYLGKP